MKVLIISHNAISTTNNMGKTLLSLFSEFKKEELCQLYIHPMIPDVDVCSSYYCITDEDVLHSLYSQQLPGHVVDKAIISGIQKNEVCIPQEISELARTNNSIPIKRLLRDLIWRISKWDNKKLDDWLKKEKPNCIFLAPGYAKFIYDIALVISERLHIPITTYICDDYYFVKNPKKLVGKIQLLLLKKKTSELFKKTSHLIAISEEIKEAYAERFGVKSTVIMTGSNLRIDNRIKIKNNPVVLSYFGNIGCNRSASLAEIGKTLDEINKNNCKEYKLKIYASGTETKMFEGIHSIQICEFLSGEEFEKEFLSSDLLIHVEAFDQESIDLVKNSISTKIADSLWSGIPMVVYGPEEVAVVKYLKRNAGAYVISNSKDLYNELQFFLCDKNREECRNALELAKLNHDKSRNSKLLKSIIREGIYNE